MATNPTFARESGDSGAPRSGALDRHLPGLDGIRAMSIVVVLAYHAGLPWVHGAFLGISQFFTLSGFLITSILLRARDESGRIDLGSFWTRRYRRLLPAAYLTLAGVVAFGATIATEQQLEQLPAEIVASLAQVVNWFFIAVGQSYADVFSAPSPVQHFWSLAIEEQFYLVMPLVVMAALRRSRSVRNLGIGFAVGAAASTAWMAWLWQRGANLDRLYFGTDTRAAELLIGCTLAVVLHRRRLPGGRLARTLIAIAGTAALGLMLLAWNQVGFTDALLWRGGFAVFALLSCALIVNVLSGSGPAVWLLALPPVAAVGRISYGIYLFHWPIFLWLDERRTGLERWPLFALRIAVTFAIAAVSYAALELPIRRGLMRRSRPLRLRWIAAVVVVGLASAGVAVGGRDVQTDLAGLEEVADPGPPPVEADTFDILAITDTRGRATVSRVAEFAQADRRIRMTIAPTFGCVASEGSDRCSSWFTTWPDLVAERDPDLIWFHVTSWPRPRLSLSGGAAPLQLSQRRIDNQLNRAFDGLSAGGAPIVWSVEPANAVDFMKTRDPLRSTLDRMVITRNDVRRIETLPHSAGAIIADLEVFRRHVEDGRTKILVVGDSMSRTLGYGLEHWGNETEKAVVWSAGTGGCGVADDGTITLVGRPMPVPSRCRAVRRGWRQRIEEFDPDIVVVLSAIFDLQQRRLDEWDDFRIPGDPGFDEYLVGEYVDAFDILSAGGATVVWMNDPCSRAVPGPWPTDARGGVFDPGRIRHANSTILPAFEHQRREVRIFDLFSVVCPNGEFADRLGGIVDIRPDGVHFGAEGSRWLARTIGSQILALAPRKQASERIAPAARSGPGIGPRIGMVRVDRAPRRSLHVTDPGPVD